MAVKLADTLKPMGDFNAVESTNIGININGTSKTLQAAYNDGDLGGGSNSQVSVMPEPSVALDGKVVQYIGETDANYTQGYFYICERSSAACYKYEDAYFFYVKKPVQIGSVLMVNKTGAETPAESLDDLISYGEAAGVEDILVEEVTENTISFNAGGSQLTLNAYSEGDVGGDTYTWVNLSVNEHKLDTSSLKDQALVQYNKTANKLAYVEVLNANQTGYLKSRSLDGSIEYGWSPAITPIPEMNPSETTGIEGDNYFVADSGATYQWGEIKFDKMWRYRNLNVQDKYVYIPARDKRKVGMPVYKELDPFKYTIDPTPICTIASVLANNRFLGSDGNNYGSEDIQRTTIYNGWLDISRSFQKVNSLPTIPLIKNTIYRQTKVATENNISVCALDNTVETAILWWKARGWEENVSLSTSSETILVPKNSGYSNRFQFSIDVNGGSTSFTCEKLGISLSAENTVSFKFFKPSGSSWIIGPSASSTYPWYSSDTKFQMTEYQDLYYAGNQSYQDFTLLNPGSEKQYKDLQMKIDIDGLYGSWNVSGSSLFMFRTGNVVTVSGSLRLGSQGITNGKVILAAGVLPPPKLTTKDTISFVCGYQNSTTESWNAMLKSDGTLAVQSFSNNIAVGTNCYLNITYYSEM